MADSSFAFTPSNTIDASKERDWAAQLGMLDWDNTSIVFTKRSLLEFLKYSGITVDPNFMNIQKLPRYAQFGTLSAKSANDPGDSEESAASSATAATSPPASDFKPTRRVREPPGGTSYNIFQFAGDDDALANAPPKPAATASESTSETTADSEATAVTNHQPKSRRTTSGIANLWDAPDETDFRPTRRVRENPGGKDSISELF